MKSAFCSDPKWSLSGIFCSLIVEGSAESQAVLRSSLPLLVCLALGVELPVYGAEKKSLSLLDSGPCLASIIKYVMH